VTILLPDSFWFLLLELPGNPVEGSQKPSLPELPEKSLMRSTTSSNLMKK
jgi:hypothetical protein